MPDHAALRLGFAGTPEFAASILAGLVAADRPPAVVYTQPDRPTGRGRKVRPSPVKSLALAHELPNEQPQSLRDEAALDTLRAWRLDVLVVAAYGLILPPRILEAPRLGCINVHASLLPRWRGAAPVERAIMAGDRETGICIMHMDKGLDTGPIYLTRQIPIGPHDDAPALEAALAEIGVAALLECLDDLPELEPVPQPAEGATYADKLTRADAVIDWTRPASAIAAQIRALTGRMPAFTFATGRGSAATRIAITRARAEDGAGDPADDRPGTVLAANAQGIRVACGSGVLVVQALHVAGRPRPMAVDLVLRGQPDLFTPGTRLQAAP